MTPIEHFNEWYKEELKTTTVRLPAACCLSTIGIDGFPNARFVSLKDIVENNFIVTGPVTSRKGIEINTTSKVALTFWWTDTERQVRIQGIATKIGEELADKYFAERNRDSQVVSIVSQQGQEVDSMERLIKDYEKIELQFLNKALKRPVNWGGYIIDPIRIEFLQFNHTRFHTRRLFEKINEQWEMKQLQP